LQGVQHVHLYIVWAVFTELQPEASAWVFAERKLSVFFLKGYTQNYNFKYEGSMEAI
jgi:hypothetical protein